MAWDPTQPTDTTKIRNLGVVIRPNWVALEQADATMRFDATNYKDRTVASLPVNPTAIADTFINFCKTSTDGGSELFGIDENSAVIQFTNASRIGGPTQNFQINNYKFATRNQDYSINNILNAYGRFNGDGSTVVANNCTITRIGTGQYRVNLTIPAGNALLVPVATAFDEGNARICKIAVDSSSQFRIRIVNEDNTNRDCGGYFHVCGGF